MPTDRIPAPPPRLGAAVHATVTLRQLEVFLAIADAGSIALASTTLHASESAVAASLTALENALDVQLCVRRRSHGISLTASGRLLRERARDLLLETSALEHAVGGRDGRVDGAVHIGCPEDFAPTILSPILELLSREHPDLDVTVEVGAEEGFWPRIATGEVDLTLTLDHRLPDDLASLPLIALPPTVVLPAGHRLAELDRITPADLAGESWIMLQTEPGRTHATSMFNRARVRPTITMRAPTYELARSLVGRGLGFTIHIQRPWGDMSQEGRALVYRPLDTGLPVEYASIAWSAKIRASPAVRAVLAAAKTAWPTPDPLPTGPRRD
jgi:DNA-binding transcriptional LysR family regulator